MRSPNRKVRRAQEDNLFDRTDVEAWQHVELTVTNCSFGLTIKFIVNTAVISVLRPSNIQGFFEFAGASVPAPTLGDRSEGDPPVPIPNTEVKPLSPDGTARASVWERRKLPGISQGPTERSGLCVLAGTYADAHTGRNALLLQTPGVWVLNAVNRYEAQGWKPALLW